MSTVLDIMKVMMNQEKFHHRDLGNMLKKGQGKSIKDINHLRHIWITWKKGQKNITKLQILIQYLIILR